jgi:hypothetical protein
MEPVAALPWPLNRGQRLTPPVLQEAEPSPVSSTGHCRRMKSERQEFSRCFAYAPCFLSLEGVGTISASSPSIFRNSSEVTKPIALPAFFVSRTHAVFSMK